VWRVSPSFVGPGDTREHLSQMSQVLYRDSKLEYSEYEEEAWTFRDEYCYNVKLRENKGVDEMCSADVRNNKSVNKFCSKSSWEDRYSGIIFRKHAVMCETG
jgi:hypothetical protein